MKTIDKQQLARETLFSACEGLISMSSQVNMPKKEVSPQEQQKSIEAKLNKAMSQFLASLTPDEYQDGQIQKFRRGDYLVIETYLGRGE